MAQIQPPLPKTMVFVDGSNFYHRMKDVFGRSDISYRKFIRWLGLTREITQLFYYVGEVPGDPQTDQAKINQNKFLDFLRRTPLVTVRLGYIQRTADGGYEEKSVDPLMGSDLVLKAHLGDYDEAVLVTADGDLVTNVREARQKGRKVYVAQFSAVPSYHLRQECDGLIELDCPGVRACLRGPALK
jgi:uncharacterized LabA/DUF88 family protein